MTTLVTGARVGAAGGKPRPVIVDTDIGDDIDDTWALLMLLRESRIEVKLAVGDFGNPLYRARLLARLLDETG
ncbi:MAG: nucleoside hydrolase, partial [Pseudomonadota bacterium]